MSFADLIGKLGLPAGVALRGSSQIRPRRKAGGQSGTPRRVIGLFARIPTSGANSPGPAQDSQASDQKGRSVPGRPFLMRSIRREFISKRVFECADIAFNFSDSHIHHTTAKKVSTFFCNSPNLSRKSCSRMGVFESP